MLATNSGRGIGYAIALVFLLTQYAYRRMRRRRRAQERGGGAEQRRTGEAPDGAGAPTAPETTAGSEAADENTAPTGIEAPAETDASTEVQAQPAQRPEMPNPFGEDRD